MKVFVFLFLFLFCFSASGRTVYCSSTMGDDRFLGQNSEKPVRTIRKALTFGDTILLKAGDVFYETVSLRKQMMGRYGNGEKPIICGYKRIVSPKWVLDSDKLWKICLVDENYSGFCPNGSSLLNNIGCIHEFDKDRIHGRKVQFKQELNEEWDMWQTSKFSQESIDAATFDTLYLYCSKNPNDLKLEFSVGCTGVSMEYSTIEGVDVKGFGCHGIAGGTETVIRNCDVDAIGGKCQIGYSVYTCLGNGIEFYIAQDKQNCLVKECTISRCYDCGITIQGSDCGKATPRNIVIENNLIRDCCQGWEDFLRNDPEVKFVNCIVRNNIFVNNGKGNGFGYPKSRFKYCHVLGNNFAGNKGLILEGNIFIGGNYYCSGVYDKMYRSHIWLNNVCYIKRGNFILSNYIGTADVIYIPTEKRMFQTLDLATESAISDYRKKTGDETTRFIICSDQRIRKQQAKELKKYYKNR